jgi:hypothetical protein
MIKRIIENLLSDLPQLLKNLTPDKPAEVASGISLTTPEFIFSIAIFETPY